MSTPTASAGYSAIQARLRDLYGDRADEAWQPLQAALQAFQPPSSVPSTEWTQQDVVLITYGDQVNSTDRNPLQTLREFLLRHQLQELINTVHFLPCFPYSSDDGFSVIDYEVVDPELGSWEDLHDYQGDFHLMLDFVVNHISQQSSWFQHYLRGDEPYDRYFIEASPEEDLRQVVRPRSLPLLSEYETSRGARWIWTTFSRDQVDLNYSEPRVLAEIIRILLDYVQHGARLIRLDAIAYLWKQIGTSCIHLPQTHQVVKLFRDVTQLVAPHVWLLTETNVPHQENISYFGDGDEAQMVYQFSLPPLLLDAFLNQDAQPLKQWLAALAPPPAGTTFFNFTASHDGIGVRPLEGLVTTERLASLVEQIQARGGLVGTRRQEDGSDSPYELNITYVDALSDLSGETPRQAQRFLSSQAVMLALQGVPAVYFHSLVGTQNDLQGVEESSIPRRINRRKFQLDELENQLADRGSLQQQIFEGMQQLLRTRVAQAAFHPEAEQIYHESHHPQILTFERRRQDPAQAILVAVNFGSEPGSITVPAAFAAGRDLLDQEISLEGGELMLQPAQSVWLEAKN